MRIFVDGQSQEVPDGATMAQVLSLLKEAVDQAIVELNYVYVNSNDYEKTKLKEGDRLEVIYPAFGG